MINYYELVKSNPEYFRQLSCKDLLFLNYDCPTKLKKIAKWSQHNYIYYVISGKKTLYTPERSFSLLPGSISLIKKGACIVEQFFDHRFCVVVFVIPDSFIVSLLDDAGIAQKRFAETAPIIPVFDNQLTRSFYQSIMPYFGTKDAVPEPLLELKFRELLLTLLSNPENRELNAYFHSLRTKTSDSLQEIMESNYAYNLGLDEYARITHRSLSSFKRDFQAIYKMSPGKWLLEKKLNRAKFLLADFSRSITDVAFESGFESNAHFSRIFRQKFDCTPNEYRSQVNADHEVNQFA